MIDDRTETGVVIPSTAVEAVSLIGYYDERQVDGDSIISWQAHFLEVDRLTKFAPDFRLWNQRTRELESLAQSVFHESQLVVEAASCRHQRLPWFIEDGIYARVETLKLWLRNYVYPVRERPDYRSWLRDRELRVETSGQLAQGSLQGRLLDLTGCTPMSFVMPS